MNKSTLSAAIAAVLGTASLGAHAALTTSAVLEFDPGVYTCIVNLGTPPNNCYYGTNIATGSYFGMDIDGNGTIQSFEKTALVMKNGIHMGVTQGASGSHFGFPFGAANNYTGTHYIQIGISDNNTPYDPTDDIPIFLLQGFDPGDPNFDPNVGGTTNTADPNILVQNTTEVPGIDQPWGFFGNTGMHFTTSPITVIDNDVNNDGGFTKTLDFNGWRVTWNGIPAINLGTGAPAMITCSTASCSASSTFTLTYSAVVPAGSPSGFGNVGYSLNLVGHVAAIPVPAAVWLFGSGLLGLVGAARRKSRPEARKK